MIRNSNVWVDIDILVCIFIIQSLERVVVIFGNTNWSAWITFEKVLHLQLFWDNLINIQVSLKIDWLHLDPSAALVSSHNILHCELLRRRWFLFGFLTDYSFHFKIRIRFKYRSIKCKNIIFFNSPLFFIKSLTFLRNLNVEVHRWFARELVLLHFGFCVFEEV